MPKKEKSRKIENLFGKKLKINVVALDKILLEIKNTLLDKNDDYGCLNIMILGEKGVFTRLTDKYLRQYNLVWRGQDPKVKNESVEDTWRDIGGYGIIGLMVRRGMFAVEEKK